MGWFIVGAVAVSYMMIALMVYVFMSAGGGK